MSKIVKIEPDSTYVLGVFTTPYAKSNETDNPKFKAGYEYSYLGSILNNSGINTIKDLWTKNPYNLNPNAIWHLYKIEDNGAKQWITQGQFMAKNETLSDDDDTIPEAIRSRSKDSENETHFRNDIINERNYLRERVTQLEQLNANLTQQLGTSQNSLSGEAQKRMDAQMELRQAVIEAVQQKNEEILDLKYQIREMQKQHELETELKQKAIEETLRDEMNTKEIEIQQAQQETLSGIFHIIKPAAELGVQWLISEATYRLQQRKQNNEQGLQQTMPQVQQQMATYDPNAEPGMYASSEVLT